METFPICCNSIYIANNKYTPDVTDSKNKHGQMHKFHYMNSKVERLTGKKNLQVHWSHHERPPTDSVIYRPQYQKVNLKSRTCNSYS